MIIHLWASVSNTAVNMGVQRYHISYLFAHGLSLAPAQHLVHDISSVDIC